MDEDIIKEIIKEQKEELNEWKNKLKNNLSKNPYQKEEIILITKMWLDNYEKYFLNNNNGEAFNPVEIDEEIKNINNDLFNSFIEEKNKMEKLPMIFALSKNIWMKIKNHINNDLNSIITRGYFGNKILISNILESIYCIFFLDDKGKIKQGYLEIINKNNEDNIVNYFYQNGLGEYKNFNKIGEKDNYMIIMLNKETNIIKQKKTRSRTHNLNIIRLPKPDEINFSFGNKEFNIRKKYNIYKFKEL